jgi:hypothetical protein
MCHSGGPCALRRSALPPSAPVVNCADVEGGSRLRLALEAAEGLRIAGHLIGQELKGDEAVEARILGLVDYPHLAMRQIGGCRAASLDFERDNQAKIIRSISAYRERMSSRARMRERRKHL